MVYWCAFVLFMLTAIAVDDLPRPTGQREVDSQAKAKYTGYSQARSIEPVSCNPHRTS